MENKDWTGNKTAFSKLLEQVIIQIKSDKVRTIMRLTL